MRSVILFTALSLDGYIAGPQGEIDWLFQDEDYGYSAFYERIDTMLVGRKTFNFVNGIQPYPHADRMNFIFSRTLSDPEPDYIRVIAQDPVGFTRQLKTQSGKSIWLVGGGDINQILLDAGLVDELVLSVHPVVLGQGIRLFSGSSTTKHFNTKSIHQFPSGLLQWHLTKDK